MLPVLLVIARSERCFARKSVAFDDIRKLSDGCIRRRAIVEAVDDLLRAVIDSDIAIDFGVKGELQEEMVGVGRSRLQFAGVFVNCDSIGDNSLMLDGLAGLDLLHGWLVASHGVGRLVIDWKNACVSRSGAQSGGATQVAAAR